MDPSAGTWHTPLKGGKMILNRFCIDEDAAFELSGVNCLKESVKKYVNMDSREKGKEYVF